VYLLTLRPGGVHEDAIGFAAPKQDYVAIVLPAIARTAYRSKWTGAVLGATMAHEIGHLLLGERHSQG